MAEVFATTPHPYYITVIYFDVYVFSDVSLIELRSEHSFHISYDLESVNPFKYPVDWLLIIL